MEQGLCYDCSNPVVPGFKRCATHLINSAIGSKTYRKKNIITERKKSAQKQKKRFENNQCTHCGAPLIEEEMADGLIVCMNCSPRSALLTMLPLGYNRFGAYYATNRKDTSG